MVNNQNRFKKKFQGIKLAINTPIAMLFLASVIWEIIFFIFAPKQAYMQGVLESWYAAEGLLFYKDVVNAYLPFLKLIMYLFHQIVGYSLIPSALLSLGLHVITLSFLYIISKKWLTGISQILPILFFEIWNNYLGGNLFSATSFLGLLLLTSFVFWWSNWKNPTKIKSIICGLLFSCSILTLQIVAPFIIILTISASIRFLKAKDFKNFLFFGFGILIPWLIVFSWVLLSGIVNEFLYWNLFYYFGGYPYSSLGKDWVTILVFFAIHLPLLIFLLPYKNNRNNPILVTFFASFMLLLSFWSAVFHPMRFQISLPVMALILGIGIERLSVDRKNVMANVIVGSVLGINILCFVVFILPSYSRSLSLNNVDRLISEIYPGDPMYDSVKWGRENIPDSARIFVLADTYYYLATRRLPANSRNTLGVEPIFFYPLDKFRSEINLNQPDYWIIDERLYLTYANWGADDVAETIKKFLKCQDQVAKFDYWKIYKKNTFSSSCILQQ